VPELERDVVPDAGHFMHIEQPVPTAERILAFLGPPS
jgi:pimeloyl-ACP methyl ester carboxylesterase